MFGWCSMDTEFLFYFFFQCYMRVQCIIKHYAYEINKIDWLLINITGTFIHDKNIFSTNKALRLRRAWRYQRGNQNPYIEEEQTTQWPKEKIQKDKQRSTKHTHKTKDRVTRISLKIPLLNQSPYCLS